MACFDLKFTNLAENKYQGRSFFQGSAATWVHHSSKIFLVNIILVNII